MKRNLKKRWSRGLAAVVSLLMLSSVVHAEEAAQSDTTVGVVINEIVFNHSEEEDAVELYNAGTVAVDLSGYTIHDDAPDKHTFTIPEGTVLEPEAFLFYYKNKDNVTGFDFGLGKNDLVTLKTPEGVVVDEKVWTVDAGGATGAIGRIPDGSDEWQVAQVTLGSANVAYVEPEPEPQAGSIVINEIDSQPADWVELYNPGTESFDVSGYELRDNADDHRFQIVGPAVVEGGSVLVIDDQTEGLIYDDQKNTFVPGSFGQAMGLGGGDSVRLFDPETKLVDEYSWTEHAAINGDKALATYARIPDGSGEFMLCYATKGELNRPYYPIVINEIESNGDATDWVEIINIGNSAVNISGWYILDNDPVGHMADTVPLPENSTIEAGEFFVFDGTVHFNFGLGKNDEAVLYDRHGNVVDGHAWQGHAEGTLARIPDGTGEFQDVPVGTKGSANTDEPLPPVEDDRPEAQPWPGPDEIVIIDETPMFLEDSSGLDFAAGKLWAVDNGTGTIWQLDVDENGIPSFAAGWEQGKRVQFQKDAYHPQAPGPDAEGITVDGNGLVYIASERDNAAKGVNYNVILQVDPTVDATTLVAQQEWDITAILPLVSANTGIESVEWVSNSVLSGKLFNEQAGTVYLPEQYPGQVADGVFFVALENNGHVYAISLQDDGSASVIADIDSLIGGAMGLDFDTETGLLWVESDNGFDGRLATIELNGTNEPIIQHYAPPAGMDTTLNNEGFAIAGIEFAKDGRRPVYWFADGHKQNSLRMGWLDSASDVPQPTIAAVKSVTAKALDANQVQVQWEPVEDAQGYIIYRKLMDGALEKVAVTSTPEASYVDESPHTMRVNFYFVFPYKIENDIFVSGGCTDYGYARPELSHVSNLRANVVDRQATLRWNDVEGAEAYVIYRKVKDSDLQYMYIVEPGVGRWTDLKPTHGETYFYFVVPTIKVGNERRINLPSPYTYAIIPK